MTKDDHSDELLKCHIQMKMRDDTFIVYIEELGEKRLVPWSHLRPLRTLSPSSPLSRDFFPMHRIYGGFGQSYVDRYGYNLHGNTKSRIKRQRIANFTTDFPYNRDAICNSGFDFEPYINLSNFNLNASNAQREIIAYPMVYSQTSNMQSNNSNSNSSNGGNSTGNSKSKNRQSHNAQHPTNDGETKVTVLKNETDNGNGNSGGGGGSGTEGQKYGKNGQESKSDSQSANTSSSSTTSHQQQQQSYHHQQHQMSEPSVTVDTSSGMPATVSHPQMSSYYHQGQLATAAAPVYYYPAATDDQNGIYPSDVVVQPGVYAIPATAYQSTTSAAAMPTTMQPGMYAPATQSTHYPIPVNGWPAYTQPMNPQGKTGQNSIEQKTKTIHKSICSFGFFLAFMYSHIFRLCFFANATLCRTSHPNADVNAIAIFKS